MRAYEQERESLIGHPRATLIIDVLLQHQRELGLGRRGHTGMARAVHEPAARGGQKPALGIVRHTPVRPRLQRREQGVAERVLGARDVTPARGEIRNEPTVRRARRELRRGGRVAHAPGGGGGMFGRTSVAPVDADGQRAAHSSALSRSGTSIT